LRATRAIVREFGRRATLTLSRQASSAPTERGYASRLPETLAANANVALDYAEQKAPVRCGQVLVAKTMIKVLKLDLQSH